MTPMVYDHMEWRLMVGGFRKRRFCHAISIRVLPGRRLLRRRLRCLALTMADHALTRVRRRTAPSPRADSTLADDTVVREEGDVVLIRDKEANRNDWPIGVVTQSLPSADGMVRKVEVKIARNGAIRKLCRPISEVMPLFSPSKNCGV
ncbi:hypothetical protein MRX96_022461 [Rhipicephalus microplus]